MIFRRPESLRERTLLRLIEQQQRIISDQNDRIMYLSGQMWTPPPPTDEGHFLDEEDEPLVSALHGLPPTYLAGEE